MSNNDYGIPYIKPYHFYIQHVIPLVFDDSLSYLELVEQVVKKLNEVIENINSWSDVIKNYTDEQIAALKQELLVYINQQDQIIIGQLQQTQAQLRQEMNQLRSDYQQSDAELRQYVADQLANNLATIQVLINGVNQSMELLRQYVNSQDTALNAKLEAEVTRLEELIKEMQINPNQMLRNPTNNKYEPIQVVTDTVFYNLRSWGLRAKDYDRLNLTAEEYDQFQLGAWNYDYLGKWYLREKPEIEQNFWGLNPWTGTRQHLREIIYWGAAYLRIDAVTAQEYDDLELEAEVYDGKGLTAYQYDWEGRLWLYPLPERGITATEYDTLQIQANRVVNYQDRVRGQPT